jgi:hypothetical protein
MAIGEDRQGNIVIYTGEDYISYDDGGNWKKKESIRCEVSRTITVIGSSP